MPPVGGFVALCVHNSGEPGAQKTKIHGDFFKIKETPSFDVIKGKLMINYNAYRICHGGIKVRLEGLLQVMGKVSLSKAINILEQSPTETVLSCGDLMSGQKRLTFTLNIPTGQAYPTAFMTSNGSITYRLVALIQRDSIWEIFAKKLVNFKGYYNVQGLESNPMVDRKLMKTKNGEVLSTFTVPNTVIVMGCWKSLDGTLDLRGLSESRVNATLTFFRNINYGGNIHTECILSQNRQAKVHEDTMFFKWKVVFPMISRISYSNELVPMYSVRYYLKAEIFYVQYLHDTMNWEIIIDNRRYENELKSQYHVMHVPSIVSKARLNAFGVKEYEWPSGRKDYVHGNDPRLLDILVTQYSEDEIIDKIASFPYINVEGNQAMYYPDAQVGDTIYEAKSWHTYGLESELRELKMAAVQAARKLQAEMWVFDGQKLNKKVYRKSGNIYSLLPI